MASSHVTKAGRPTAHNQQSGRASNRNPTPASHHALLCGVYVASIQSPDLYSSVIHWSPSAGRGGGAGKPCDMEEWGTSLPSVSSINPGALVLRPLGFLECGTLGFE